MSAIAERVSHSAPPSIPTVSTESRAARSRGCKLRLTDTQPIKYPTRYRSTWTREGEGAWERAWRRIASGRTDTRRPGRAHPDGDGMDLFDGKSDHAEHSRHLPRAARGLSRHGCNAGARQHHARRRLKGGAADRSTGGGGHGRSARARC